MLTVNHKANYYSKTNGADCLENCLDKNHFLNYKKEITYQFNSLGFRDFEWPLDLSDVVWCIGDSFTVGIGQPFREIWPQTLEKKISKRCLNIGEDGCSNDTIALRALEIYKIYKPKLIIIMWSYFHRRRIKNEDVHFDKKTFGFKEDIQNFIKNFLLVENLPTKTIHLTIPNPLVDFTQCSKNAFHHVLSKFNLNQNYVNKINTVDQLDFARDYHHFDIETSEFVCNLIIEKIKDLDN